MNQEKLQLTTGNNNNSRRKLDNYPTPSEVTIALMEFLRLSPCHIWEPACGNYDMSKILQKYKHIVYSTDIIYGDNYLTLERGKWDAIITNPPFYLSEQFIRKALTEAPVVCMLLKSQYWHAKKRYELFMQNKPTYILPLTWRPDFMNGEKGGSPTMDVLWTVWIKGNEGCEYIPLLKP